MTIRCALPQQREMFKGSSAIKTMLDKIAGDDRSGSTNATPAVQVDQVTRCERLLNSLQDADHMRTCRYVHITDCPALVLNLRLIAWRFFQHIGPVGAKLSLILLREINETGNTSLKQALHLPLGNSLVARTGVLASQQLIGKNPVGFWDWPGWLPLLLVSLIVHIHLLCSGAFR
jgi:hypothetical protein